MSKKLAFFTLLFSVGALLAGTTFANNDENETLLQQRLTKPIERSYDLYQGPGRRALNWSFLRNNQNDYVVSQLRGSQRYRIGNQNSIRWARKETPGFADVLAPAEKVTTSVHWKNRRRNSFNKYLNDYYNLYKKPELESKEDVTPYNRYYRPDAYTLNGERSGKHKLQYLYR